jgi:hypothetical protein
MRTPAPHASRSCGRRYEPFAIAIARHLALDLPDWLPRGEVREEWQAVAGLP